MNIFFKLLLRRLGTWKTLADGRDVRVVRNQINYIITKKRVESIKPAETYPGADYNLLWTTLKVNLKSIEGRQTRMGE